MIEVLQFPRLQIRSIAIGIDRLIIMFCFMDNSKTGPQFVK